MVGRIFVVYNNHLKVSQENFAEIRLIYKRKTEIDSNSTFQQHQKIARINNIRRLPGFFCLNVLTLFISSIKHISAILMHFHYHYYCFVNKLHQNEYDLQERNDFNFALDLRALQQIEDKHFSHFAWFGEPCRCWCTINIISYFIRLIFYITILVKIDVPAVLKNVHDWNGKYLSHDAYNNKIIIK